jgi:hypothetical protein
LLNAPSFPDEKWLVRSFLSRTGVIVVSYMSSQILEYALVSAYDARVYELKVANLAGGGLGSGRQIPGNYILKLHVCHCVKTVL